MRYPLTHEATIPTERVTVSIEIPRPTAPLPSAPAKLRILETANQLFYDDGIRNVGVDRLISASSVTKATFYKHYGSKDRLITEYIDYRHRIDAEWVSELAAADDDALTMLRSFQEGITRAIESPGFRGCPFINAAAEFPDGNHPVRRAVERHREWYVDVLEQLLRRIGHPMSGEAADDLMLARDGAMTGGYAGDPIASTTALNRAFERVIAGARSSVSA
ncbi:MAG: TetR/AcrR family transcriptional regulator [Schumannella sp.]|nr:TetR/AcrR family transcriptional regulator [Schumannella sp.]